MADTSKARRWRQQARLARYRRRDPQPPVTDLVLPPYPEGLVVYLLHFSRSIRRRGGMVQHYLGCTANLARRMVEHRTGRGPKSLRSLKRLGVALALVAVWPGGWGLEQQLKGITLWHLCPICRARNGVEPWLHVVDGRVVRRNGDGQATGDAG
jgi:hypothetical protein